MIAVTHTGMYWNKRIRLFSFGDLKYAISGRSMNEMMFMGGRAYIIEENLSS